MSFCRITGKARGLPRPNYFPLLPPISPADAKRFCRITGKAYGLPGHHYTPVLLVRQSKKPRVCALTSGAAGNERHRFPSGQEWGESQRHVVMADFRYVFPSLEESAELGELMAARKENAAQGDEEMKFVYTVAERRCSLVIPARLEAAVRDGEVRGVLLAEDADEVRFQLRKGRDVTVGVRDLVSLETAELWEGEGQSETVKPKKKKRKKNEGLTCMAKIFEEKERAQEAEERKMEEIKAKRAKVVEVKLSAPEPEKPLTPETIEWHRFDPRHHRVDANLVMCSGDWRDLVKPLIESWDWEEFEKEAAVAARAAAPAVVTALPKPVPLKAEVVDLEEALPGLVQQPPSSPLTGALPPATTAVPLAPLLAEPDPEVDAALKAVPEDALALTSEVAEAMKSEESQKLLPEIRDIPQIVSKLGTGKPTKLGPKAHGLMLDIGAAKKFVSGQTVQTPAGPVFVPGQTLDTPSGPAFVPGMTVATPDGLQLIPGRTLDTPAAGPVFVAGQTVSTRDGERFVPGQTVLTSEGPRFMPGQTVVTPEGPRFVAGQTVMENGAPRFVPGHTVSTPEGARFVPGQSVSAPDGGTVFVPGQSVRSETEGWEFVPGQAVRGADGECRFVAGQTVPTEEGPKFVPGRAIATEQGVQFVAGVTVEEGDGALRFVAGRTVQTAQGAVFVQGQVVRTACGAVFVPGKVREGEGARGGGVSFAVAKSLEEAVVVEAAADACEAADADVANADAVFGHMVQTAAGVEFFPGIRTAGLPAGKLVPGRLHRSSTRADVRFVPGIEVVEETGRRFVPGQVVETERGEQFVPGQVVDTAEGPKFVPGQVVETRAGPKFVPGQTVDTPEGPRFVPGQIVETKAGPTFIPGQVISTAEEGCRFVPGQVVDTMDGPRFVPGRVVETGDRVTFVPGQVVETKEGLRFVAPDLTDTPEGCQFSVQGFEVSPEELKLLKPSAGAGAVGAGKGAVDSRMLRQLSEAGVAVGRHVPADLPGVAVAEDAVLASQTVKDLSQNLQLEDAESVELADVLGTVVRLGCELLQHTRSPRDLTRLKLAATSSNPGEESVREFVRSLVAAVALTASQAAEAEADVLQCAGSVLGELLLGVEPHAAKTLVQSLHAFLSTPGAVRELREDTARAVQAEKKVELLKSLAGEAPGEGVAEKLTEVLGESGRDEVLAGAFVELSHGRPGLVGKVLDKVSKSVSRVHNERDAAATLQRAIVSAVKESSDRQVREALIEGSDLEAMVGEAAALARALGLFDAADSLLDVLEEPETAEALAGDPVALDVLRRLSVMRALAARRPEHAEALRRLRSDPFDAREDPKLRELVRDSAVLLVAPDQHLPLASSADVPTALLLADNSLAVEDFLAKSGHRHGPLLILKPGLQTVIPREASRAVLTGQVSYTVLDDKGIRYFEPLHVLSALRLPRFAAHRFSMYRCAVAEHSISSSSEDLSRRESLAPADSVLGSAASTSTTTPRRRRRGSLDTGTGSDTLTLSPRSESGSALAGPTPDLDPDPEPKNRSGYLDAETRIRIASALAYRSCPIPSASRKASARDTSAKDESEDLDVQPRAEPSRTKPAPDDEDDDSVCARREMDMSWRYQVPRGSLTEENSIASSLRSRTSPSRTVDLSNFSSKDVSPEPVFRPLKFSSDLHSYRTRDTVSPYRPSRLASDLHKPRDMTSSPTSFRSSRYIYDDLHRNKLREDSFSPVSFRPTSSVSDSRQPYRARDTSSPISYRPSRYLPSDSYRTSRDENSALSFRPVRLVDDHKRRDDSSSPLSFHPSRISDKLYSSRDERSSPISLRSSRPISSDHYRSRYDTSSPISFRSKLSDDYLSRNDASSPISFRPTRLVSNDLHKSEDSSSPVSFRPTRVGKSNDDSYLRSTRISDDYDREDSLSPIPFRSVLSNLHNSKSKGDSSSPIAPTIVRPTAQSTNRSSRLDDSDSEDEPVSAPTHKPSRAENIAREDSPVETTKTSNNRSYLYGTRDLSPVRDEGVSKSGGYKPSHLESTANSSKPAYTSRLESLVKDGILGPSYAILRDDSSSPVDFKRGNYQHSMPYKPVPRA